MNEHSSMLNSDGPPKYGTESLLTNNRNDNSICFKIIILVLVLFIFVTIIWGGSELDGGSEPDSPSRMPWEEMHPEMCLRYGTRQYTARVPFVFWRFNRFEVCTKADAEINGRRIKPDYCEAKVSDAS